GAPRPRRRRGRGAGAAGRPGEPGGLRAARLTPRLACDLPWRLRGGRIAVRRGSLRGELVATARPEIMRAVHPRRAIRLRVHDVEAQGVTTRPAREGSRLEILGTQGD